MSVMVGEEEPPRVSLFRAQLRSVLETLLNDAVTEITRVYHVSTSGDVFTMEEDRKDSAQDQTDQSACKFNFNTNISCRPLMAFVDQPPAKHGIGTRPYRVWTNNDFHVPCCVNAQWFLNVLIWSLYTTIEA